MRQYLHQFVGHSGLDPEPRGQSVKAVTAGETAPTQLGIGRMKPVMSPLNEKPLARELSTSD